MKKILIISGNNHLFTSGVDMYTKRLIDIFKKENCIVDEYSFGINMTASDYKKLDDIKIFYPNKIMNDCKKFKIKWWIKNIYNVFYRSQKQLNKLIDNYDLIIDSSLMLVRSKKILNSDKYLYIQHQGVDFFEMKRYGFKRYIAIFLVWLTGFKNSFKYAKNIVFYDDNNKNYIKNKFKNFEGKLFFTIVNSIVTREEIEENRKKKNEIYDNDNFLQNIIYIGRITIEQKRMNDVNKVLTKTKNKLDVWGFGTYSKKISKNKNINFHGKLDHDKVLDTIISSKFSLLFSDYEGLSTSMVESICAMTPIIIRNSHLCAGFLTDNNKNGFLLNNKYNKNEYAIIFDELSEISIDKLREMSENCYKFAIKHLVYETFEKKWLDVYHKIIDN